MYGHCGKLLILGLVALHVGCPDREVSAVLSGQQKVEEKRIPTSINRKLDLLFVIDNSGSMTQEQESLRANFPNFMNLLKGIDGGLPDVHIGVVTSDMGAQSGGVGDNGVLQARGVTFTDGKRYLRANGTDVNFAGDLNQVFSQMASVGDKGSGFEQHLAAAAKALDPATSENAGFLREDAYLAIVIIADEDDCSVKNYDLIRTEANTNGLGPYSNFRCARHGLECDEKNPDVPGPRTNCKAKTNSPFMTDVASLVAKIKATKTNPKKIIVASIAGPATPVVFTRGQTDMSLAPACSYNDGGAKQASAAPGVRIGEFVAGFSNSSTTTICKDDLSEALTQIGRLLKTVLGSPCFDANLEEPLDCSVSDIANYDSRNEKETLLAPCTSNGNATPCWRIETNAQKCPAPATGKLMVIDRGGTTPPNDTLTRVGCVTR